MPPLLPWFQLRLIRICPLAPVFLARLMPGLDLVRVTLPRLTPPGLLIAGPASAGGVARSGDVDAEVRRDAAQAALVALADRAELPLGAVAVELAEEHGGLRAGVLAEVVAGQLGVAGVVDDADERVAHLTEGLAALLGV